MQDVLLGSSILGAFIGGIVALLAPCCITVLLPSYFAASFTSFTSLLRMTFLFAAGIATVILPIAIGLAALGQLFSQYHTVLFVIGGLFLVTLGVMTLRGRGFELPFLRAPTFRSRPGASIYVIGVFSGAASSCCAPVLIGVLTLTALTTSLPGAVAVSLAYVFGMVFPLFLLALAGDRLGFASSRLIRGTTVRFSLLGRRFSVNSTNLIGGVLLIAIGVLVLLLAATGNEFIEVPGLRDLGLELRSAGNRLLALLTGIPGFVVFAVLAAVAAWLWWQASRSTRRSDEEVAE